MKVAKQLSFLIALKLNPKPFAEITCALNSNCAELSDDKDDPKLYNERAYNENRPNRPSNSRPSVPFVVDIRKRIRDRLGITNAPLTSTASPATWTQKPVVWTTKTTTKLIPTTSTSECNKK